MHKFSHPLETGIDANTGLPVFGFNLRHTFITEPLLSECGRFTVDPVKHYGVTEQDASELAALNQLVDKATQEALNAGCVAVQKALGIAGGDLAKAHFSDYLETRPVALAIVKYIQAEYQSSLT